ncbi:hypothetical protein [Microbacterium sp. p3-SID336]|uniref:hypothetical protein n=1 Tax=Microbacterium sp. p3-SID336 TaxID=2916212 RepID=UPI0021A74F3F|nr:hypothetical protein [Microbacterium sp. p3-SID336]MCT1478366.1 hypothetical protein [Microbacterium sp. p3-SID336]
MLNYSALRLWTVVSMTVVTTFGLRSRIRGRDGMKQDGGVHRLRYPIVAVLLCAGLALVLGFLYRLVFLAPLLRERGGAEAIEDALRSSVALFVVLLVASLSPLIAHRMSARWWGRVLAVAISGFLVAAGSWFLVAQANRFPIAAGLIASLGFFVLLVAGRRAVPVAAESGLRSTTWACPVAH